MSRAFLFPGQGSQSPGMGADLAEAYDVCRRTFAEADEALDMPLSRLCFEGPAEELQLTAVAQPAILATSVAVLRALEEQGLRPDHVAGHSLGEYSALVAAGGLKFADALRLVRKRGTYMQEAVPVGAGAMAAVLGLPRDTVEDVCSKAADGEVVSAANLNGPGQVVISGHTGAVERAIGLAKEAGARKVLKLQVSAPFHCELMAPAAEQLKSDLDATEFSDLDVPLVCNVGAEPITGAEQAREALFRQMTAPVRWEESVLRLVSIGMQKALEVGPGKVLCGLVRKIDRTVECVGAGTCDGLETAKEFLS